MTDIADKDQAETTVWWDKFTQMLLFCSGFQVKVEQTVTN